MTPLPPLMDKGRIGDAVLIPVLSIAQAVAMGIGAFATRDAFSALHLGQGPAIAALVALLGAGIAVALLGWLIKQRAEAIGQSYANALRLTLYRHIAGMNLTALEQRRVGALSLRFVGDLSAARNWFGRGLPLAISALVTLPGAATVLWLLHPHLALAAFVPLCAVIALTLGLAFGLERRHRTLRRKRANLSIAMIERIAVAPMLDLMGRTPKELRNLNETGTVLRRNALERTGHRNGLSGLMDIGASLAGVGTLLVAGQYGITAGLVAAALAMIAILVTPLRELALVWDRYCGWRVAREKAQNLLAQPSASRTSGNETAAACVQLRGVVTLDVAAGAYHRIDPQSVAANVDLLRVIAGLDGAPEIELSWGAAAGPPVIAYIGERSAILQGSLRRAVTLGLKPRPSDAKICKMLAHFGLTHLAEGETGLGVRVSEGGRSLAPQDRFILELVRAALANAGLVLIDGVGMKTGAKAHAGVKTLHRLRQTTIIVGDGLPGDRSDTSVLEQQVPPAGP